MKEQKEQNEKQGFGMIGIGIPAEVLFNPYLTQTEKMLFGFIRNLAQSKNGCWASNWYLGLLFNTGSQTITNSITKLKIFRYIRVTYERTLKDRRYSNNQKTRKIFINEEYLKIYRKLTETANEIYVRNNGDPKDLHKTMRNIMRRYRVFYKDA